jgi:carboxypeptidase C (cathepsin A)
VRLDARLLSFTCLLIASFACIAWTEDGPTELRPGPSSPTVRQDGTEQSPQDASVSNHTIQVGGTTIHYRASAGHLPIRGESGRVIADIFFVAYERQDATSQGADRPITFAFNGGPGSSAVWLHMGGLGPKRALLAKDGTALPLSTELVDNEHTWLEFTDLVFVDPVGSGFSRPAAGVDARQFYEVRKDIELASDFVRLFVTRYERWLSPQYIAGESYGTARAVGMARYLQNHYGLYVDGLVLLSSALNMGVISFDPGNDLPYVLALPTYTASARYHGRLGESGPRDFDRTLGKVREWALQDYIAALAKGGSLGQAEFRQVAGKLAEYTGLPEGIIAGNHLRIGAGDFIVELLRSQNRVLGLLDSRVTTGSIRASRRAWTDPSFFLVEGPFVAAFSSYVRAELGFKTDLMYVFLSDQANRSWNWGEGKRGYLNVAPTLAEAMTLDTRMRVFNAAGYYDLATPYLSQEYVLNHLDLPPNLRNNITLRLYHAGHQIYTSTDALRQLTSDVRAFMAGFAARSGR